MSSRGRNRSRNRNAGTSTTTTSAAVVASSSPAGSSRASNVSVAARGRRGRPPLSEQTTTTNTMTVVVDSVVAYSTEDRKRRNLLPVIDRDTKPPEPYQTAAVDKPSAVKIHGHMFGYFRRYHFWSQKDKHVAPVLKPLDFCLIPNCLRQIHLSARGDKLINHLCTKHGPYYAEYITLCQAENVDPESIEHLRYSNENIPPDAVPVTYRDSNDISSTPADSNPPLKRRSSSSSPTNGGKRISPSQMTDGDELPSFQSSPCTVSVSDFAAVHRRNVAVFHAENSIARHVAQSPSFKKMLHDVRTYAPLLPTDVSLPVVNANHIRDEQVSIANDMRGDIINKLRDKAVTVAIDGWTDTNRTKVTNVVLLNGGNAYYWAGIFNKKESNTGDYVAKKMIPILMQLRQHGLNIVGLATDNEAVMLTTHEIIANYVINGKQPFSDLIHVRCAAHTINLIVQEVLMHGTVSPLVAELVRTINFIRGSKTVRQKFMAIQHGDSQTAKLLPVPIDVRWNSYYVVLCQCIKFKAVIMSVLTFAAGKLLTKKKRVQAAALLAILDTNWWMRAEKLSIVLAPFAYGINLVQSDTATLHTANIAFDYIRASLSEAVKDGSSTINLAAAAALEKFSATWWTPLFASSARQFVWLLIHRLSSGADGDTVMEWRNGKDNATTTASVLNWFYKWGADYLIHVSAPFVDRHGMTEAQQRISLTGALERCYWHFNAGTGGYGMVYQCYRSNLNSRRSLSSTVQDVDTSQETAAFTAISQSPHVEFKMCCRALLQIVPSEAAVERTFSAQGMIMTKRRNRLADNSVMSELAIKFNRTAMSDEGKPRTFDSLAVVVPMDKDEDSESDDDEQIISEVDNSAGNEAAVQSEQMADA